MKSVNGVMMITKYRINEMIKSLWNAKHPVQAARVCQEIFQCDLVVAKNYCDLLNGERAFIDGNKEVSWDMLSKTMFVRCHPDDTAKRLGCISPSGHFVVTHGSNFDSNEISESVLGRLKQIGEMFADNTHEA